MNTRYHTINVEKSEIDRTVQQLRELGYTCEGIQTAATEWVVQVETPEPISTANEQRLRALFTNAEILVNFETPCEPW